MSVQKRKIGIVGYGSIGKCLHEAILKSNTLEIAFIWNRSIGKLKDIPQHQVLHDLDKFAERNVDLIVEVAHISITHQYGERFLDKADFMIGSPTALADVELETKLRTKANCNGLYVPAGAFWGGEDIKKMADLGTLKALTVTMKKHPSSFKLCGDLVEKNENVGNEATVLYQGPVRNLCPLAPMNVNTMACAAIAAHNLGFDEVQGCLVSDRSLNSHIIEIDVTGPTSNDGEQFTVRTVRINPSKIGAVTGNATYNSFVASLERAHGKGPGIHLC